MRTLARMRRAASADASALRKLDEAIFPAQDRFSLRRYRYLLASPHAITYLVEEKGEVIGSIIGLIRRSSSGRVSGRMYSIGVLPTTQQRGLGSRLLRRVERELRARGAERIVLETRAHGNPAEAFFRKHGYSRLGLLPRYYFNDDGVKMEKWVTDGGA